MSDTGRTWTLHLGLIALLVALGFVLPEYHHGVMSRVMVLSVYAMGYNLAFGYTGLLSLGHAMFFAAGMYGLALPMQHLGVGIAPAFLCALLAGALLSAVIGALALRTSGVAFMIVTLMFSQAAFLTVLLFGTYTRGDEGIVIPDALRSFSIGGTAVSLADPVLRYNLGLALLALAIAFSLAVMRSRIGHVLVAIRENEGRTAMLGYDVARYKLLAFVMSGTLSAISGAAYALLFAYAGSTLASIQYSIHPLLWTLLGGAATVLGPVLGTALMFLLVDWSSSFTSANLLMVGVVLILLVLFFPKGILGTLRERWLKWLP